MPDTSNIPEGAESVTVGDVLGKKPGAAEGSVPPARYQKWAKHFPTKLRATQLENLAKFEPVGAHPGQLARIKASILAAVNDLPERFNAVELKIEANYGDAADQEMFIVFKHEI